MLLPMHYTLKRVQSKAIRIRVHAERRVVVAALRRVSERAIEKFVDESVCGLLTHRKKIAAKPKRLLQSVTPADYKKHKAAAMTLAANVSRTLTHTTIDVSTVDDSQ